MGSGLTASTSLKARDVAGSVVAYETGKGKKLYRVRYPKPDGRWTSKRGFETKREANLFLASVTVSIAKNEYLDPSKGKVTVETFAAQWRSGRLARIKESSRNVMESSWRNHVEPKWGHRLVNSIRTSEVDDWVGELIAKPLGAQSVRRCVFVLSSVLSLAQRDGIIHALPTANVLLPAKPKKPKRYLTHAQVDLLAESSAYPDLTRFLAYTGLRWGEAAALRVRHLDMLRRRIYVEENAVKVNGRYVLGTPKSGSAREVPMPVFQINTLARLCEGKTRDAFLWGEGLVPLPYPNAGDGWFVGAVKRAQRSDNSFPRITLHELRHTAASLAVQAGGHAKAVQRMLGHASAAMTMDVYADLFDDDLDTLAERMSTRRAESLTSGG